MAQVEGSDPKPAQRFADATFLGWAEKLRRGAGEVHAVYEACGFGFALQRQLTALGITCHVVSPQKLDERGQRVKTEGRDAKALCLKLDRFIQGNKEALAVIRIPSEEEEQRRAVHRQREQLVKTRKQLEAQGRSLLVNHGLEGKSGWWKARTFKQLELPRWLRELLENTQPILLALERQIRALTRELRGSGRPEAAPRAGRAQQRGHRPRDRRLGPLPQPPASRQLHWLMSGRIQQRTDAAARLCHQARRRTSPSCGGHGNPRLRAALVEAAWRLVRFQPTYRAVVKWRRVLAKGALATGAARKKAIVAVARQLAVDLWRLRTGQLTPAKLGLI